MVSLLTNGVVDYLQKKWVSREFRDWTFMEADSIGVTIGSARRPRPVRRRRRRRHVRRTGHRRSEPFRCSGSVSHR